MKLYLKSVITEQINRGKSLKRLIRHPLKYAELNSLATRCSMIIDQNIEYLKHLSGILESREGNNIKDIFRGFRSCVQQLSLVEYYGISALCFESPEIGYMNKVVYKIHREMNLPLTPPAVACMSTSYYGFHPFTSVIFVPVAESEFLLHLPDLYHEIGHFVLQNREEDRLKNVQICFLQAVEEITRYYEELIERKRRETGPKGILMSINFIHSQWKDWINEFFSDLFALVTLGPSYVWAHLHLTIEKSEDVYKFSEYFPMSHPSDEARMRMLLFGLEVLGFKKISSAIMSKWRELPLCNYSKPVHEYQYAYPDDLIQKIVRLIYDGLKKDKFIIAECGCLEQTKAGSIIKMLNEAWPIFWERPEDFREWEERNINLLKQEFLLAKSTL
jgi:hypothetical protein